LPEQANEKHQQLGRRYGVPQIFVPSPFRFTGGAGDENILRKAQRQMQGRILSSLLRQRYPGRFRSFWPSVEKEPNLICGSFLYLFFSSEKCRWRVCPGSRGVYPVKKKSAWRKLCTVEKFPFRFKARSATHYEAPASVPKHPPAIGTEEQGYWNTCFCMG